MLAAAGTSVSAADWAAAFGVAYGKNITEKNRYIKLKVSCCDRCVDGYGCRLERNFAVRTMLGADRQSVRIRHLHMNGHVQVSVLIGYRIVDNDCQGTYRIRAWDMHPNPMLFAS